MTMSFSKKNTITDQFFDTANSPEELLDLVDKNDTVLGVINREVANKDPRLTHREISVLLFDENKNVVIQKRSRYKSVHPGWWSVLAGHIPAGADPQEVAYSELEEEFGLTGIELQFLVKQYMEYEHESHFMYYFVGKYSGEEMILEESEVEAVRVLSRSQLLQMIASGETFNEKHLPILYQIWDGKFVVNFFK